jgi:hypothetical protein
MSQRLARHAGLGSSAMPFAASAGPVVVGTFVDERGEPANWLGAIRGGFGNPLKVLETPEPVARMVQSSFEEAVRARSRGTKGAQAYELRGTVKRLDCSQYVRREAHGVVEIVVVDSGTKKEKFRQTYTADVVEGSLLNLQTGVFASVDELKSVAQKALHELIDKALDDAAFRDAIAS